MDTRHLEHLCAAVLILSLLLATAAVAQTFLLTAGQGGTINATNGPAVTLGQDLGLTGDNPVATDGSVTVQNTTIDGPAGSTATLSDPSSTSPLLEAIDTNGGEIEANTTGIQQVNISGGVTRLEYRDVDLQDDQTVELDADGTGTLHVHGFTADEWLRVNRASGDDTLIQTDSAGVLSIPVSNGAEITVVQDGGGPTLSDPSPTGGADLNTSDVELSVNVTDPDFDTANESVALTWHVDGIVDGTSTVTANGTATWDSNGTTGGSHEWWVEATDITGATATSGSANNPHTYNIPDQVRVVNESNTNQLVGTPPTVTVRFYGENQVFTRTGNPINMTGLPVDQPFFVSVNASSDYYARTIYIEDIYTQNTVYLLPQNVSSVEARFNLDDPTGQYDSETILYIEKAINTSASNSTYQTIYADQFGVEGVTARLEQDTRYNIRVQNVGGDSQQIGPYRADVSETVTVRPGSPTIPLSNETDGVQYGAELDNVTLEYRYNDPTGDSTVTVWIHEKNNESNQLAPNQTYASVGEVSAQESLSVDGSELTWVVVFDVTRDGDTFVARDEVTNPADLVPSFNDTWKLMLGLGVLFISSGVFSFLNRGVGAVVTGITGGLLYFSGWLSGATAGAGIVLALFVAILYNLYTANTP